MPTGDSGAVLALLIAAIAGVFLAGAASFFVVSSATNAAPDPIDAPLVTYDAQ